MCALFVLLNSINMPMLNEISLQLPLQCGWSVGLHMALLVKLQDTSAGPDSSKPDSHEAMQVVPRACFTW